MTVKYVIHTEQAYCKCFSDQDLIVNLRLAIKQGVHIVAVSTPRASGVCWPDIAPAIESSSQGESGI